MNKDRYHASSLETAACLWEAVLEILSENLGSGRTSAQAQLTREEIGTNALRLIVLGWVDAAEEDWATVKEDYWNRPFDWEWIPEWITNNVVWDGPRPELRCPRIVPGGYQADLVTQPAASPTIELNQALGVVFDLAEQNVIDHSDHPEEHARQIKAIEMVRQWAGEMEAGK